MSEYCSDIQNEKYYVNTSNDDENDNVFDNLNIVNDFEVWYSLLCLFQI